MAVKEKLRLDKYLWAIRLFKTRSLAAAACDSGKVKFDGLQAKPARTVNMGDEYEVAAVEAVKNYLDITPPEEVERLQYQAASFQTGKRQSKIGRPTKKERRDLDGFLED
jgi:ribosome-associated heat shock protein Hsp15